MQTSAEPHTLKEFLRLLFHLHLNNSSAHKQRRSRIVYGIGLLLLILLMGFFRYFYQALFPAPELLFPTESQQELEISQKGSFVISFSQKMQKSTVEEALQLNPDIPYQSWWRGNELVLTPHKTLKKGDHFQLTLSSAAENFFGTPLEKNYHFSYRVGDEPTVLKVFPEGEVLKPDDAISILFSHPMISDREVKANITQHFVDLDPQPEGDWVWHNAKTLVFTPKNPFPFSAAFRLRLKKGLHTRSGTAVREIRDRAFHTRSLQLLEEETRTLNFAGTKKTLTITEPMRLVLDHSLDEQLLRQLLSIRQEKGKVLSDIQIKAKGSSSFENGEGSEKEGWVYELVPASGTWSYNETYTLDLLDSLEQASSTPRSFSFTTENLLSITDSAHPEWGYFSDEKENTFQISLKESLPIKDLEKSLTFVPDAVFTMAQKDEKNFSISLDELSQKRESIVLYLKESINTKDKLYLTQPLKRVVERHPTLEFKVSEDGKPCLYATTALNLSQSVVTSTAIKNHPLFLQLDTEQSCEQNDSLPYSYLIKSDFSSSKTSIPLQVSLFDVYGQSSGGKAQIQKPTQLSKRIKSLSIDHNLFAKTVKDLSFDFITQDLSSVQIQICKLSAEKAIEVESSYQERWASFNPSAESCSRLKTLQKEIELSYGNEQRQQFILFKELSEPKEGLYFVRISSPQLLPQQDEDPFISHLIHFSSLQVLSKRGKSSLVWVLDEKTSKPISDAQVTFFSADGEIIKSGNTDRDGINFDPHNDAQYEFVVVKNGDRELRLDALLNRGLESWRYGIPHSSLHETFFYHVFLEDHQLSGNRIRGVAILKEKKDNSLVPAQVSTVRVTLENNDGESIWSEYQKVDAFGNIFLDINPQVPLLDDAYDLRFCIGLYVGICQGESFFVQVERSDFVSPQLQRKSHSTASAAAEADLRISIQEESPLVPGSKLSIAIGNLEPLRHTLLTLEKDGIHHHQVFVPEKDEHNLSLQIPEQMGSELMISLAQFTPEGLNYTLDQFSIDLSRYQLSESQAKENPNEVSTLVFTKRGLMDQVPQDILSLFYPESGTSIVTASIPTVQIQPPLKQEVEATMNSGRATSVLNGRILQDAITPSDPQEFQFVLQHDKKGRFNSFVKTGLGSPEDYKLSVRASSFIRADDTVLFTADLKNLSNESLNAHLTVRSDQPLIFSPDHSFTFGMSPKEEVSIPLTIDFQEVSGDQVQVDFFLGKRDNLKQFQSISLSIPLASHLVSPLSSFAQESLTGTERISIKAQERGMVESSLVLSPSPIAYVLGSLKNSLEDHPRWIEDSMKRVALLRNYADLLEPDFPLDDTPLSELLNQQENTEDSIRFLSQQQIFERGSEVSSQAVQIASTLADFEQYQYQIPPPVRKKITRFLSAQLQQRLDERLRDEIAIEEVPAQAVVEEMKILNALSSLSPSGIPYAKNWFQVRDQLSNEAAVLLLLTFEDYRDFQVSDVNFRIEEMIQLLKSRRTRQGKDIWLQASLEGQQANDFLVSSWYLEALVRQASAHSEIPELINWLVRNKYEQEYQSMRDQYAFLNSMSLFLRLFQEQIQAETIQVSSEAGKKHSFQVNPNKPFQSFLVRQKLTIPEEALWNPYTFESDKTQPLFYELSWKTDQEPPSLVSKGISLYQNFEHSKQLQKGDLIEGNLDIVSPEKYHQLILVQSLPAGVQPLALMSEDGPPWKVKANGAGEWWYFLEEVDPGLTRIPFQWEAAHEGEYSLPPAYIFSAQQTSIFSSSLKQTLRIGN